MSKKVFKGRKNKLEGCTLANPVIEVIITLECREFANLIIHEQYSFFRWIYN